MGVVDTHSSVLDTHLHVLGMVTDTLEWAGHTDTALGVQVFKHNCPKSSSSLLLSSLELGDTTICEP